MTDGMLGFGFDAVGDFWVGTALFLFLSSF